MQRSTSVRQPVWSPLAQIGARGPAPSAGPRDALRSIAMEYGIEPGLFERFAQLDSAMDPNAQFGRHAGLFQLDPDDFKARGGKDIYNPIENATIAAQQLRTYKETIRRRLGRDATPVELYIAHSGHLGGLSALGAHAAAPDRPAWLSLLATREGQVRGPEWAKSLVRTTASLAAESTAVEAITSREFVEIWRRRVEGGIGAAEAAPRSHAGA